MKMNPSDYEKQRKTYHALRRQQMTIGNDMKPLSAYCTYRDYQKLQWQAIDQHNVQSQKNNYVAPPSILSQLIKHYKVRTARSEAIHTVGGDDSNYQTVKQNTDKSLYGEKSLASDYVLHSSRTHKDSEFHHQKNIKVLKTKPNTALTMENCIIQKKHDSSSLGGVSHARIDDFRKNSTQQTMSQSQGVQRYQAIRNVIGVQISVSKPKRKESKGSQSSVDSYRRTSGGKTVVRRSHSRSQNFPGNIQPLSAPQRGNITTPELVEDLAQFIEQKRKKQSEQKQKSEQWQSAYHLQTKQLDTTQKRPLNSRMPTQSCDRPRTDPTKRLIINEQGGDDLFNSSKHHMQRISQFYCLNGGYLDQHPKITWSLRAHLAHWLTWICAILRLKRDTFYLALYYVDRYLSQMRNIDGGDLQLIGLTCLSMASKIEEIQVPSLQDFVAFVDFEFTSNTLALMELQILQIFSWRCNPATLSSWAGIFMSQWDGFVLQVYPAPWNYPYEVQFRTPNGRSYINFRRFYQRLDTLITDIQTLMYEPQSIVLAIIYMTMMTHETQQRSGQDFLSSNRFVRWEETDFNNIFLLFLDTCTAYTSTDLIPVIQFCSNTNGLKWDYSHPWDKDLDVPDFQGNYEAVLAYQTYTDNIKDFINK